ncbi:hypothetical protein L0F63_006691, partial [Massospora cicadina]
MDGFYVAKFKKFSNKLPAGNEEKPSLTKPTVKPTKPFGSRGDSAAKSQPVLKRKPDERSEPKPNISKALLSKKPRVKAPATTPAAPQKAFKENPVIKA